jgi:hypothetical protein
VDHLRRDVHQHRDEAQDPYARRNVAGRIGRSEVGRHVVPYAILRSAAAADQAALVRQTASTMAAVVGAAARALNIGRARQGASPRCGAARSNGVIASAICGRLRQRPPRP